MRHLFYLACILAVGCTSTPIVQEPEPATGEIASPAQPEDSGRVVVGQPPAPEVEISVEEPRDEAVVSDPAVAELLRQAELALQQGDATRSVSLGERAMLIDRYDPQVYLLLARTHRRLGNLALSRQYAGRGLAYTRPGSLIYLQLDALR